MSKIDYASETPEQASARLAQRIAEVNAAAARNRAREEAARPAKASAPAVAAEPPPQVICLSEQDERDVRDRAATSVRGTADNCATDATLTRWEAHVHADAALHGGVVPPKVALSNREVVARLSAEPAPLAPPADTETELNGLIAECRYLMREIAFNSARLTYDPDDRVRFLASAQSMALAAAKVGRTVAQLRGAGGGTRVETKRCELVYRHEHTTLSPHPSQADSAKQ